jgi:hypothetical protein
VILRHRFVLLFLFHASDAGSTTIFMGTEKSLDCRKVDQDMVPTTWRIRFNLDRVVADGTYTLRIALAASETCRLQV